MEEKPPRSTVDKMKWLYVLAEGPTEETFVRELLIPHYARLGLFIIPINDDPSTAPSKRILALMPGYEKPFHGPLIACDIGWMLCVERARISVHG